MNSDWSSFAYLARGAFWRKLWLEINRDDCWGLAAQCSFYFLLAFFPFLLFLSTLISFVPLDPNLLERILREVRLLLPEHAYTSVTSIADLAMQSGSRGVLSVVLLLTLWWASMGISGMVGVLNRAYAVREQRSFVRVRLLVTGVTILVSAFVITSGILLFFGDRLVQILLSQLTLTSCVYRSLLNMVYTGGRWLLVFLLLNLGIQIIYFALPARHLPWTLLSPGSVIATMGWIIASRLFALYVNELDRYQVFQQVQGSLAALVLLMIWFYISSLFLLVGGEINSEIYRMRSLLDP